MSGSLTYSREDAQYKTWKNVVGSSTYIYRGGIWGREERKGYRNYKVTVLNMLLEIFWTYSRNPSA